MVMMRGRQAVARALADEMEADERVILMGEDVGRSGGVFKATSGLFERFGPKRVWDTPISEMGFLGAALGAAMAGLRPVVEIMWVEFAGVALDQIVTEAAKVRFLSRGTFQAPMVIRASVGAGMGFGCQHGQVLDHWFRGTAGLKVVVPSDVRSCYSLLRAAIQDPDPVVVLEPRTLYGERQEVGVLDGQSVEAIGAARLVQSGEDVTIVGCGQTVPVARAAASTSGEGWTADVIDLRSVAPWDRRLVLESVRKTGRLVTVEEAPEGSGWGSDVVAHVSSLIFDELAAPPIRITAPDVPVPFSEHLEQRFIPDVPDVRVAVDQLVRMGHRPEPWWIREGVSL